ncbi:MAG: NAD-dependent epimerase/dehydratase family protein [Chloroflexi bacterium AL-W]|nr:NAD-dependent epimerase/dehydratase family protein [Chloroflexi bacterium AL-N1]NOK65956.1 NAD-dependent epimerase/dehydratase family protein [Chloroflexi bacterium AL-N10]NOK72837.1 NAD-dependent epimerase/dehydratase family protein [Chloroflexi bacterium AL-N5]NOK79734.1 NAD-dependent epimerase/dehydratase family protein [Chloroflexi bacterium AL-W]NOK88410.1 NAD-dependent epimerase/dehydratase family protein [Chloroflexi bacterium AL-N15]
MKAFVTGSTGLLGSNLVRLLVQQGYEVKVLARSVEKACTLFDGMDVSIVQGDMHDIDGFALAMSGCDVLFHTAAFFREYYQPGKHWGELERINVTGTIKLLEAAEQQGVKKVIYTSSVGVIGHARSGTMSDEATPPDDIARNNLYFWSKVLAEQAIDKFLEQHQIPVVLILPGWMFGPRDNAPTGSGQVVLAYLNQHLPGIFAGGNYVVDARDVAQGMINAVQHGQSGERYIIAGRSTSFAEIVHILEKVSGVPAPKGHIPYWVSFSAAWLSERYSRLTGKPSLISMDSVQSLNRHQQISSQKAEHKLGVSFRPLEETLDDEVVWYRQYRPELVGK